MGNRMAYLKHVNRAYISKKLKDGLSGLEYKRYNYICAPTGYGKTLVCSTFYKNYSRRTVLWIDADTTPDIFWKRLCTSLNVVNATTTFLPSASSPLSVLGPSAII